MATDLKAELKRLMDQRGGMEAEIAQRSARLEAAGVGLHAPLLDAQGFPRADVDVAAIRADRHAIITLTNDHKALSRRMEQLLHALHAQSGQPGSASSAAASAPAPAAPRHAPPVEAHANGTASFPAAAATTAADAAAAAAAAAGPFATVDELSAGSPAAEAGLQLNDQLCNFGGVTLLTPNTLQAVAAVLQASEGRPLETVVLRHGAPLALTLTPRPWGGRGLLGCHLRPL